MIIKEGDLFNEGEQVWFKVDNEWLIGVLVEQSELFPHLWICSEGGNRWYVDHKLIRKIDNPYV